MRLKSIELLGFKSFARKVFLDFAGSITAVVGPNGSGKSNIAESFRFALGEQSMKSMRGKRGEDMIWNGSQNVPRSGRASVRLVFDNSDRALGLDFDQVVIERVVHRDGVNEYMLNNSLVRLRDVVELLAKANVGSSSHHIISQGEADRVLSASPRERRAMLEDALGLTTYLYKRDEAEKKLEKTAQNMKEVELLRRELAPHLKFLSGQVKKIDETERLRNEVCELYLAYLRRESVYVRVAQGMLTARIESPERELLDITSKIHSLESARDISQGDRSGYGAMSATRVHKEGQVQELERERGMLAREHEALARELGRLEGELAAHERISTVERKAVPHSHAAQFATEIESVFVDADSLDSDSLRIKVKMVLEATRIFIKSISGSRSEVVLPKEILIRKVDVEKLLSAVSIREVEVAACIAQLRTSISQDVQSEREAVREAGREILSLYARKASVESDVICMRSEQLNLEKARDEFRNELGEAGVLVGMRATEYDAHLLYDERGSEVSEADIVDEDRSVQRERKRKLDRMKIRLEEVGLSNATDIIKEYRDTSERDQFLVKELADLEDSAVKLRILIAELVHTLSVTFDEGIHKVNQQFDAFFKLMFGGGVATLALVDEVSMVKENNEDMLDGAGMEMLHGTPKGVEVSVSLPNKRVKGLNMLSGGERSLVSIALIFAMSQINPPPFLILDETDAALDEANSRRYGDMIETLAKSSQLILITHNRETMSRAGQLYGVTMVGDGVSKLLTVKLQEALAVAK